MHKKYPLILVIVLGLVIVVGGGYVLKEQLLEQEKVSDNGSSIVGAAEEIDTSTWKTYQHDSYTVKYPNSWIVSAEGSSTNKLIGHKDTLRFQSPDYSFQNQIDIAGSVVTIEVFDNRATRHTFPNDWLVPEPIGGASNTDIEKTEVDGFVAYKESRKLLDASCIGCPPTYVIITIIQGNKDMVYSFRLSSRGENAFVAHQEIYENMVSSFIFR